MSDFVCAYMGCPDECPECGGLNETGGMHCSHECAADYAERGLEMERHIQERRAREDAFGEACADLRRKGHSDKEIDVLLAGMPT
jgi:hypothetical protein